MNFHPDLAFKCLDSSPCGYMLLDADQRICFWNRWLEQHSQLSNHDLCGSRFTDIFPSLRDSRLQDTVVLALESGLPSIITPKLNRHPLPLYSQNATGENIVFPQVLRIQCIKHDADIRFCLIQVEDVSGAFHRERHLRQQATDLQQQTQALGESKELFRSLFSAAPVGLFISSTDDLTIQMCNEQASHLLQIEAPTKPGSLYEFLPRNTDRQTLRDYASTATEPNTFTMQLESQQHPWGLLSISPCSMDGEPAFICGLLDISRRVEAEEIATKAYRELEKLTVTDYLTGAYNRRYFADTVETERQRQMRNNGNIVVLMIDIDHFKQVNDTYGHVFGDLALKHLVKICNQQLREVDTFARLGGEEFAVLLLDNNEHGALTVAEKLRCAIAESPVQHNNNKATLTISIGVNCQPAHRQQTFTTLLDQADQALYRAKATGRNRVVSFRDCN
ncbi:MAG: sensor domain-containing diguanylate cyclase [Thermodesulfobacteriota bacterium]|nr:sensor domain-containing diguanylate cyclase [Thermodesulfobacteriota bacterium]